MAVKREKSPERRRQITEAALELLATVPLEKLTTRLIAKRVGVSQPALFRHFKRRDDILRAAVDTIRAELGDDVAALLGADTNHLDKTRALFQLLYDTARARPGLVRLLLSDTASGDGAEFRAALDHLSSLQEELVTTLLRQAQEAGEMPAEVDCRMAARLFVGLVQGTLISALRHRDAPERALRPEAVCATFRAGLMAGEPRRQSGARPSERPAAPHLRIDTLDVRPILASGRDPLGEIRARLAQLTSAGVLLLTAPFEPRPLIQLLTGQGYALRHEERRPGVHSVLISAQDAPVMVDLSHLPAPEPLERSLEEAARLEPGEACLVRVPQRPNLLLPRLAERGLRTELALYDDGAALVYVSRAEG